MTTTTVRIHIQLQPFFLSRKKYYQLLHLLFLVPSNGELLFEIRNNGNLRELEEIHDGGKILWNFFDHMTDEQINREYEEYQRLFIGPGQLVAPPWESYYRSREQLLFEEWNYQIREQYHLFGLQYKNENNEPDDHLLLELEFMLFLADLSLQETMTDRIVELISRQIHFLEKHLTIWVPYFCKRIIEHTNSQLYLGAAMLLEDLLTFDLTTLQEVKEALPDVR
ncbi:molecular chaperone TorD family protein [Bacillus sp. ISL-40]|uniref:TorD/DmsD family molecular chaperone n=1 Tax=unclassified Bacillus (in: firmicutes) TaxID=185979 RepID=UPI001BE59E7D|nr:MULTISPECIES: molecular chaperone TorD family protein [unclassified Bacillus (in: firmicutes)]MBT2699255.1 molecular chaperone TorD family protein [Bacillus sp. ISL-40]MBT2723477.1 molecular chaperone TorD family protein [Bacillus sp. ISL-46]MBT2739885.1 molecular chaperone TorD family protein [Bacillus sp. ISL-77]